MYFHCAYLAPHEYDNINQNYDLVWQLNEGGDRRRNIDGVYQTIPVENEYHKDELRWRDDGQACS